MNNEYNNSNNKFKLSKKIIIILISIFIVFVLGFSIILKVIKDKKSKVIITKTDLPTELIVTITGEVNRPGNYTVPYGTTLGELINIAGGLSDDAYKNDLILSEYVSNSDKFYIKNKNKIIEENNNKININNASISELQTLSGIGEAKAKAIIEYRNTFGNFESIEEIMNVSGISETLFDKIKDSITV